MIILLDVRLIRLSLRCFMLIVCLQHIGIKCSIFLRKAPKARHMSFQLLLIGGTYILACMLKIDVSNVGTFKSCSKSIVNAN